MKKDKVNLMECPACESQDTRYSYTLYSCKESTNIFVCDGCGIYFNDKGDKIDPNIRKLLERKLKGGIIK